MDEIIEQLKNMNFVTGLRNKSQKPNLMVIPFLANPCVCVPNGGVSIFWKKELDFSIRVLPKKTPHDIFWIHLTNGTECNIF